MDFKPQTLHRLVFDHLRQYGEDFADEYKRRVTLARSLMHQQSSPLLNDSFDWLASPLKCAKEKKMDKDNNENNMDNLDTSKSKETPRPLRCDSRSTSRSKSTPRCGDSDFAVATKKLPNKNSLDDVIDDANRYNFRKRAVDDEKSANKKPFRIRRAGVTPGQHLITEAKPRAVSEEIDLNVYISKRSPHSPAHNSFVGNNDTKSRENNGLRTESTQNQATRHTRAFSVIPMAAMWRVKN